MISAMNVTRQYELLKADIDAAVLDTLHSGQFILGSKVEFFERQMAEYCNTKYAVGVGNGTDAIIIALRACGIHPGDEVITSAMSFFATAEAIAGIGATPVFVDCDKDTYVMDVSLVEDKITEKTKAIIPVHLYGQCVDMDPLLEVAEKYGLKVIEDTAQACGATYKGKKAGSMGDAGCFSFFPTKNLGGAGDGGMIATDDVGIYKQCVSLRVHGSGLNGLYVYGKEHSVEIDEKEIDFNGHLPKYFNFALGYNSRLDAMQAAVLSVKLPCLDGWNDRRREIARKYMERITNPFIKHPVTADGNNHIYYVYVLAAENREGLRRHLKGNGIGSNVYFPIPLHLQKVFESLGYHYGDMPNAEYIADHTIVIPMFPELTDAEIDTVIRSVNSWDGK